MKLFVLLSLASLSTSIAQEEICKSLTNTYTVKVDLFAGELGYYTFDECPGLINPTIGMVVGETYTFDQSDRSNYYHPLGFAYFPDGAHDGKDELEPSIKPVGSTSTCDTTNVCPAPQYFVDGAYVGFFDNAVNGTTVIGDTNFGLDDYEPEFFYPLAEWATKVYSVKLKFDVDTLSTDFFYFCHIHQFMSGRVKLLDTTAANNAFITTDAPEIGYSYDVPSEFDYECGTFGIGDFQLPNAECPSSFVCDGATSDDALTAFKGCINAMDCKMFAGMTSTIDNTHDGGDLFSYQMIPHHQNAVNMAKALLKTETVGTCNALTSEDSNCAFEGLLREIINVQNFQIQTMKGLLSGETLSETSDCTVTVDVQN